MIQTYPYITISNYTVSDSDKIGISASKVGLELQQDDVDFIENFTDDTGFIYDSDLAEFASGLERQKSQIDALCGANFNTDINLEDWSGGVVTGTAYNGAGITSGQLDLSGSANKYIDFDAIGNADAQQQGCIEFDWTPKYSGAGSFQYLFTIVQAAGNANNRIRMYHQSTLLFVSISDSAGGSIVSFAESFSPIADTKYKLSLNWDITNGATRLFVNGNQLGTTNTGTGTRSSSIGLLRLGKDLNGNGNADFLIDNLVIYDSVQHTSNYTPSSDDIPDYKYLETSVILPEMEKIGDGTIKLFNSLTSTYTGSPRILLEIGRSGDKLYWNGSAWVTSDETYDQATDPVTFNTNCPILVVDGEIYGQFTVVFPNSNTLSSYDTLTANMNVDIGYPTDNPYIYPNSGFKTDGLENWIETLDTLQGDDAVKRLIKLNTDYYYLDNDDEWAITDTIDYTKAMTVSEILAQKESLLTEGYGKIFIPITFLHSGDGTTTPYLDTDVITYNFSGDSPTYSTIIIFGNIRNIVEVETGILKVRSHWVMGDKVILTSTFYEEILQDGYFEIPIQYETGNPPTYLEWRFNNKIIKTNFIEQDTAEFGELTILWQNTTNIDLLGT